MRQEPWMKQMLESVSGLGETTLARAGMAFGNPVLPTNPELAVATASTAVLPLAKIAGAMAAPAALPPEIFFTNSIF